MSTIYSRMYPDDVNFLDSVESYLRKLGVPNGISPQERLAITEQARNTLYSYDVQCMPRIAKKILEADMEVDQEARALMIALYNHALDPNFIAILMEFLRTKNDASLNGIIGAVLTKVLNQYIEDHWKKDNKKDDKKPKDPKEEKKPEATPDFEEIKHLQAAIERLLGDTANTVQVSCGNVTHPEALFIAACIAMNSQESLKEIIRSDLPVTADIFGNLQDPDGIIRGALTLLKADVPSKLTAHQTAFLDSLKRWVYTMLDKIPGGTSMCYSYLVGVYGSVKPDVSPYFIQVKDCGTMYSNLLTVAKQLVNK